MYCTLCNFCVDVSFNRYIFFLEGEQSGYNIPEVQFCPDLNKWLSSEYQKEIIKREDDKDLPENIRRLLCDAYMCMYQYSDVAMFK